MTTKRANCVPTRPRPGMIARATNGQIAGHGPLSAPDPESVPSCDEGHRTLWLNEPVSPPAAQRLIDAMLRYDSDAPGTPVHLYIYTPGGCVVSGLAITDTMRHISSPVFTYALGFAASMGAVILAAGQKGHRYILPGSFVMIHQASGNAGGTMENLRATLAFQTKLEDRVDDLLARCTGRTPEEVREASRVDNWMDARQAKAFGLVDHILGRHPGKR